MNYLTSLETAEKLGITKRMVNLLCQRGELPGAKKKGNRWIIPEETVRSKVGNGKCNCPKSGKSFNTTGICFPQEHYMVSLGLRLQKVKELVDAGKYFSINRARQFGKTTTLRQLAKYLAADYLVISMDFQMQMSNASFQSEEVFAQDFLRAFGDVLNRQDKDFAQTEAVKEILQLPVVSVPFTLTELFRRLTHLCGISKRKLVLMIDEVDSATNNQVFLDFLAQFRGYYLNRDTMAIFQSVILVGVYDIKNLKRKLRPEEEHKDNSPWNIAADFNVEMAFSADEIAEMLEEYEEDQHTGMATGKMAQEIYEYTAGYPYLVSRICQKLDTELGRKWDEQGLLEAVRLLVKEQNTLFDDMAKKLKDYPSLRDMIYAILFNGRIFPYHLGAEQIAIGSMFGFLKEVDGHVAVANRIFEIWFYNLFIAEEALSSKTYSAGEYIRDQFVEGGKLNMKLILEKFVEHFTEVYGDNSQEFVEENGRRLFLLYMKPVINGTGNYYIEARTRSMGRTDLILDYRGTRYVVEMKIWHGEEYNKRGEEQLLGYLEDYRLDCGYLLSFNFNKNKMPGVREIYLQNKTLVEAVV